MKDRFRGQELGDKVLFTRSGSSEMSRSACSMFLGTLFTVLLCCRFSLVDSQTDLYRELFDNYIKVARPVDDFRCPVQVRVGYSLFILENHDEVRQVFISQGELKVSWRDEKLTWSTNDYNITRIIVPINLLWLPDLTISNDVNTFGSFLQKGTNAVLYNTGEVVVNIGGRRETYCRVDVTKFPFDTQQCSLVVRQLSSINSEVTLQAESDVIDLREYVGNNGEYTIEQTTVISAMSDVTNQTKLNFKVTFTRKCLYYIQLCVLPVICLSVLNLAVFLVPPGSGEKLTLSISVFLSYAVFLTIIYGFLPEISETVSLFGVYLSTMMSLKVVTILTNVVVLNLHFRKEQPPSWVILAALKCGWKSTSFISDDQNNDSMSSKFTWRDAASMIDQFLFTVFCLVTVLTTIFFFVHITR